MSETAEIVGASSNAVARPPKSVGVLLVHGMGSALEGDTIRSIGEPVWQALRRCARDAGLTVGHVSGEGLLQADEAEPAHVSFTVADGADGADSQAEWWMAECHWADTFRPPSYGRVMTWVLLVVPFTLVGYLRAKGQRARAQPVGRRLRSLTFWRESFLALLMSLAAVVLGPVLAGVVILLLVLVVPLSMVPLALVQRPARAVIRVIAASLGDVHMLASESFDRRAIDARLRRDLDFLLARCDSVAIVAHSAGSFLSHCLLQNAGQGSALAPGRVPLLITYGQAVWRVHAVQRLDRGGGKRKATVGFAVGALILFAAAGCAVPVLTALDPALPGDSGWFTYVPFALAALGLVASGCAYALVCRAADLFEKEGGDQQGGRAPAELGLAEDRRWRDYVASADPVPDGLMSNTLIGEGRSYEGIRLHNRRSIVSDHNTYGSNNIFVESVARDLFALAGRNPGSADKLEQEWTRRRGRTRWLATARATFLVSAASLLTASAWVDAKIAQDESPAMKLGVWLAGQLPGTLSKSVFGVTASQDVSGTSLRAKAVGVLLTASVLVLAYSLLRWTWEWWDRRASLDDQTSRPRAGFLAVWLITLAALAGTFAWFAYGVTPEPQQAALLPATALLGFVSCLLAIAVTTHPQRAKRDAERDTPWDPAPAGEALVDVSDLLPASREPGSGVSSRHGA